MSENKVRVGVRIRPLATSEIESGAETVVNAERNGRVRVNVPSRQNTFDFDWAYGKNTEQRQIYEDTCRPLIDSFFDGYNSTVFAYGQTGSGKTFTMGNDGSLSNEGIIPFAISDIFQKVGSLLVDNVQVKLELSYMEVYKEECFDLLSSQRQKCDIREGSKGETYVEGLSHHVVTCADDVRDLLREVAKVRSTSKTAMNAVSSRSHAICSFVLTTTKVLSGEGETGVDTTVTSKSFMHLVDLAGSERAKKTQASGDVFNEGVNINKGLLALGNVIAALAAQSTSGGGGFVPYRDSKITRILKDSLGGNSMTVMIACVSPADINFEETLNTLRFASRASTIVNTTSSNKEYECQEGSGVSAILLQEICVLREELRTLQSKTTQRPHSDALISLFVKLSSFTKQILIKCLEDDVAVGDEEVESARTTITSIRKLMDMVTIESEDGDDPMAAEMDFLPPLMKLIEDLENMEKSAALMELSDEPSSSSSNRSSDASEHSMESASSRSCCEDGSGDPDESSDKRKRHYIMEESDSTANAEMTSREAEVNQMVHMAELCKATISQLRREVQELENDKKAAQAAADKINSKTNKDSCSDSAKSVQMLRDKIKKLEDKQKELRKKEIEYAKLLQQKEKACKEVTALKNELLSSKRQQVEAQKRQRKEAEKYAEERRKLTLQENQSRRKEIQALEKASKISIELSNKDRVMKTKLEEKEREIKRLKMLSDKQDKVKAQRDQASANRSNSSQVSKGAALKKGLPRADELTKSQVDLLQNWIIKEVDMQSARIILREEIKEQTEQRAATYQKIVALKHEREADGTSALVTVAARSEEEIARENEIKNLEKELMRMGIELSQANGRLDNLGHDMDTRRFRNITDLKETKILLNTLFQKLANEKVVEKRALDQKINAQEQELADLRAKLAQYEPLVAPLTVTKKPRPVPEGVLGIQGGAHREKIIRKGPTLHKSSKHASRVPMASLKAPLDTNLKKSSSSVSNKSKKSTDSNHQDEGDEGIDVDDLDATFDDYDISDYDDRDESYIDIDDDDSEYEETPRAAGKGRKRISKESASQDGASSYGSRKKSRGSSGSDDSIASEEDDIDEPTFPLEKYKVAELKKFLAKKSLAVSGRKDELITRLQAFMSEDYDENTDTTNQIPQPVLEDDLMKINSPGLPRRKLLGLKRYGLDDHARIADDMS